MAILVLAADMSLAPEYEAPQSQGDSSTGVVSQACAYTCAAADTVTIIRPGRGWRRIDFAELWRFRELLYFLTWRDIRVRYKQTVLGGAWAIIQPVVTMVIFTIIFGKFGKMPSDGLPYPIFLYAALMPWQFFSSAVTSGGMSLVNQAHLLRKIYFPRLFVPTGTIGTCIVDFALAFGVYGVLMVWFGIYPGWNILLLPLLLVLTLMTALGVGFILSSLTVTYRDLKFVIPFMMQVWMFASPVVFPVSLLEGPYRWVLALNPMTGIIQGYRSALLNQPIDWSLLMIATGMGLLCLVFGTYNFARTERRFADVA